MSPHLTRHGPWAVVTGASSGLGRAVALELAAAGLHVVLVARREAELTALAAALPPGAQSRVVALDLADPRAPAALDAATADLDVGLVVLNAGFGGAGPFLNGDPAADAAMLAVNCGAVLASAASFGRRLADRGRGSLVLLSSIIAFQGTPGSATYGASKAFVQSLAEALEVELGAHGVEVLSIAPGPTHTGFAARANMKLGAALHADDVARAIVRAIGGRGTRFPGWLSRLLRALTAPLPRWVAARIFGQAMAGMTAAKP
jgi:hypothetical protein